MKNMFVTTDVTVTLLNAGEGPLVVQDAMVHGTGWFCIDTISHLLIPLICMKCN